MTLRIEEELLELVRRIRPLLDKIGKRDADLARQGRRALNSAVLNTSEGRFRSGGHSRERFEVAMGSTNEINTCLRLGEAHGYIGPQPQLPSRGWLSCLFGTGPLKPADRAGLLSGRPADPAAAADAPTVCACFSVKQNHIVDAIAQGCRTPADIGQRIKAGTNCGSCVPELRRLIAATPQAPAA